LSRALAAFHPSSNSAPNTLHGTRLAFGRLLPDEPQLHALVATREGVLVALRPNGECLWASEIGAQLNDVVAADLDRDGRDELVLARQDGVVAVQNADGTERWRQKLEFYRRAPDVNLVRAGDLDGDGTPEVIAGGNNWRFYAYRADGAPLWNYESVHPSRSCAVSDLDADGQAEVVCGTHYYSLTALKGDGSKLWSLKHGPIAYATSTGSFDTNKVRRVLMGSGDGNVYMLARNGKLLLKYNTGDEVRQVLAADLDGDGRDEVLAGSLSHYVYCFGADGKRRWAVDVGAGVSALAASPVPGRGVVVWVGTAEGHVASLDRAGRLVARTALHAGVVDLLADGASCLAVTQDGQIHRLALE